MQKGSFHSSSMNLELLIFENSWWYVCVVCVLWRSRRYSTQGGFIQVLQASTCEQAGCWLSWGQIWCSSTATSVKSSMKSENSDSYVETPSLLKTCYSNLWCPLLQHVHAFSIMFMHFPFCPPTLLQLQLSQTSDSLLWRLNFQTRLVQSLHWFRAVASQQPSSCPCHCGYHSG